MNNVRYQIASRVCAFLAVSGAVAAISWASRDPLPMVIGIPGLAAGHYYSWKRREASFVRSLILLLFMVLTAFLGGDILLSGLSDRLLLSRYLIYGLVIGSFDLMRRRNVVASLILGGLLLILISELALDLWFIVFPVLFIVFALMSVALSRVETETNQDVLVGDFTWFTAGKFWLGFGTGTLLLSTALFLLMPRLTSSEVTQATWLPSRLDLTLGGLARLPSKPGASVSPGIFPSRDNETATGERRYVSLSYTGSSGDKVVMQVRSRISSYWRGAVLDEYDGKGWLPSPFQIRESNQSRGEFVLPESNMDLSEERIYWQAFYLLSDQPNAMFIGYNPERIYLPQTGQIALEKGSLYRAVSAVPYFKPGAFRFDRVVQNDPVNLALPPISERTAALAESIVQGANTDYDKAVRLEQFLLKNYPYELNPGPVPGGRDAVDYFLFEGQQGNCSHFATAMAVMAREVGLPARVAVGYLPGVIDPMTGAHTVRAGDAHAWVEIHFQNNGWVAFDPTPRPDANMGFASGRNWVYFGLQDFTGGAFSNVKSPFAGKFSLSSVHISRWLWIVLPVTGAVILSVLLLLRRKKKSRKDILRYSYLEGDSRREMLGIYFKTVRMLAGKGLPVRQHYQPPVEYALAISPEIAAGGDSLLWLSQAVNSAAYDPGPFDESIVREAKTKVIELRNTLTGRRKPAVE